MLLLLLATLTVVNSYAMDSAKVREAKALVEKGDSSAILELGRSGDRNDPDLINLLRKEKRKSKKYKNSPGVNAQMALAKLGEEAEFKEIVAELSDPKPSVQDRAIEKLEYVGGKKSIRTLASLLTKTEYRHIRARPVSTTTVMTDDVLPLPLSHLAAKKLSRLVPDAPVKVSTFPTNEEVSAWQKWWEKNKSKYQD